MFLGVVVAFVLDECMRERERERDLERKRLRERDIGRERERMGEWVGGCVWVW